MMFRGALSMLRLATGLEFPKLTFWSHELSLRKAEIPRELSQHIASQQMLNRFQHSAEQIIWTDVMNCHAHGENILASSGS